YEHERNRGAQRQEGAAQIRCHDAVPFVETEIMNADAGWPADTGVVAQDVETTEALFACLHHGLDILRPADVGAEGGYVTTSRGGHGLNFGSPRNRKYSRTFGGKTFGHRKPDPRAGPRYQRDFPLQPGHALPP